MDRPSSGIRRFASVSLGVTVVLVPLLCWLLMTEYFSPSVDGLLGGIESHPSLAEHSKEFEAPTITKVTDGVYVAVGYAIANSVFIEGPGEEAIVVDTTESVNAARKILDDFRKLSSKRITDIVFTHNHGDHVFGAEGFIEDVKNPPDIWAYHSFPKLIRGTYVVGQKLYRGFAHQLGTNLGQHLANNGIGPRLRIDSSQFVVSLEPNRIIHGRQEEVTLAGLNLTFIHIPGETEDQLAIWLPTKRVLLSADDIYKTFPNLYAIRGTSPRNTMVWHNSLRRMRQLGAEYLVPSHTHPVSGMRNISDILTTYMAAIQYVHDQTVRHMNAGLHPDEIAERVRILPSSLASHPYLQQFYGTTVWSSKGVYENYVGWFSGDATELLPLCPKERSRRFVEMIGVDRTLQEAEKALKSGDLQWSLELVSHVFRVNPKHKSARKLRHKVLRTLAGQQSNPLARNFYMTTILDDHGLIDWTVDRTQLIKKLPIKDLLDLMRYRLKVEIADGVNLTTVIHFTDTQERYRLRILYSVLEIDCLESCADEQQPDDSKEDNFEDEAADVKIVTTSHVWRELHSKKHPLAKAAASGKIRFDRGSLEKLGAFLSYFQS